MRSVRVLLLTALAGCSMAAGAQTPTSYTVVDVGRLTGMDASYPNAINSDDSTNVKVVGTTVKSGYKKHAFYWSQSTGLRDIGVIGAGSYSEAFSVNLSGEVVGQSATTSSGGNNHAMYWSTSSGSVPLDLAPTWAGSWAYSINDGGVVVGYVYNQTVGRLWAYWVPTAKGIYGDPQLLQGLPNAAVTGSGPGSGRFITPASDIVGEIPDPAGVHYAAVWKNSSGDPAHPSYGAPQIIPAPSGAPANVGMYPRIVTVAAGGAKLLVAGSWNDGNGDRGWVWAEGDASATDIGILSSTYSTQIWGFNDLGQVSGHTSIASGSGSLLRACAWDATSGLLNLGTLGGSESRAYGTHFNGLGYTINHSGLVVGYSKTSGDKAVHAFRWISGTGMQDLNSSTLTPSKGPYSYLRDASGITDAGYITGTAITTKGQYTNTFLLVPKP